MSPDQNDFVVFAKHDDVEVPTFSMRLRMVVPETISLAALVPEFGYEPPKTNEQGFTYIEKSFSDQTTIRLTRVASILTIDVINNVGGIEAPSSLMFYVATVLGDMQRVLPIEVVGPNAREVLRWYQGGARPASPQPALAL